MDIESDDSERWEDFFGSSTDLTPSLLGIYDRLTTSLDASCTSNHKNSLTSRTDCDNNKEISLHGEEIPRPPLDAYLSRLEKYSKLAEIKSTRTSQDCDELQLTSTLANSNSGSCNSSLRGSLESVSSANGTLNKHRSNIRILSPNVQRIINHSDAEAVDAVNIEALQYPARSSTPVQHRYIKKISPTSSATIHKHKLSHIPLSKITGKLTQTGTDLVETFNIGLTDDIEKFRRFDFKSRSLRKPLTPAIYPIAGVDDDKTPTNHTAFNFESPSVINHSIRKLSLPRCNFEKESLLNESSSLDVGSNMSLECLTTENPITESVNFAVVSQNLKNLALAANSKDFKTPNTNEELFRILNKPMISPINKRNPPHPLSYARSKSLAARDFAQKNLIITQTNTLPRSQFLKDEEPDENQISAESLDRLSDIKSKFSPKESRKMSSLMLPDIAKLKHRPLSSSSICSTSSSSSSSSGNDPISGKLNISYLASVESLADENELADPHTGMTVFERACMEIVESERNYVNDLGEVIRGYLLDWKERACLKQDELDILFSNIQDVYHFNSELLKHLSESILDPLKTAKCFIELKEGFDVYTTYCTSYPEAISLLTKLLQATHTNALLASTQRMLHHTLPLGSYLLKPVQRILKYHLLLDNLRKHCDIKEVMQAYEIMRQVARNIDQVKRKLEQQTRVKELCGILDGWLGPELTVLGELRLEGILMENNKARKVLLFATMLIIAKAKEDNRLQFKSYIHQNNLMLSEHLAGEPTSFYVIPYDEPKHQIKLTAKNRDQKRLWTQHIKSVILEKFKDIPLRARELVYQLGDEEDRSTDKISWKWGLHSTSSTPTYLERRNQFRQSEMRKTKLKRKTIANASPLDTSYEETPTKDGKTLTKLISKSADSINDKSSLTTTEAASDETSFPSAKETVNCNCSKEHKCKCLEKNKESPGKTARQSYKSFRFGGKPLKERSKSVPRISKYIEHFEKQCAEKATEAAAIKAKDNVMTPNNSKSVTKRISSLKRQKNKTKETSTFYMALSEFEDSNETVLKITESSENILQSNKSGDLELLRDKANSTMCLPDVVKEGNDFELNQEMSTSLISSSSDKNKHDAEIVLDLLKNSKEFDKLYSKIQKKRSVDKSIQSSKSLDFKSTKSLDKSEVPPELPPRPPSRSPPPLENEKDCMEYKSLSHKPLEEPIYESLLRNVHVPYKFSPTLGRSKSVHSHCHKKAPENKLPSPRPESDYVTLVYTADGVLKNVGEDEVIETEIKARHLSKNSSTTSSTITLKEKDTFNSENPSNQNSLNCSTTNMTASIYLSPTDATIIEVSQTRTQAARNLLKRLWSNSTLMVEDPFSTNRLSRSVQNLERRGSDSFDRDRHSVIHLQGSETMGERIAHVDYADPTTLFSITKRDDAHLMQRDSVLSLTSSNDSVCEHNTTKAQYNDSSNSFEYENCVEACLENDFRDSAIYSDDNERRNDKLQSMSSFQSTKQHPPLKPKPLTLPPAPIIKPPGVIMCPPDLSPTSSRSWVLKQIDHFNK